MEKKQIRKHEIQKKKKEWRNEEKEKGRKSRKI